MAASSTPPKGTRILHHEMLVAVGHLIVLFKKTFTSYEAVLMKKTAFRDIAPMRHPDIRVNTGSYEPFLELLPLYRQMFSFTKVRAVLRLCFLRKYLKESVVYY
jgi:hypothetical protein